MRIMTGILPQILNYLTPNTPGDIVFLNEVISPAQPSKQQFLFVIRFGPLKWRTGPI